MEEKTKVTNEVTDRDELVMRDEYEMVTKTEDELLQEVARMEDHSRWFPGILSKDLEISPVPDRISVPEIVANTGMPLNLVMDTAIGAKLYVKIHSAESLCRSSGKEVDYGVEGHQDHSRQGERPDVHLRSGTFLVRTGQQVDNKQDEDNCYQ